MRWRAAAVSLLLLVSMGACTDKPAEPTPSSTVRTGPEGDAFYQAPSVPAGAKPGDLIWARPIKPIGNGVGHAILYWSTTVDGALVAVSGVIYQPKGPKPSPSWPILAWAHGTFGLGDRCAPSRAYTQGGTTAAPLIQVALREGAIFVETDYQGLGTPGDHPFMVNQASGRNVLDSIRAAANFVGSDADTESAILGQSQGGSAAAMAAELQPSYAPDLRLRGAVAVSTPSQMNKLDQQLSGGDYFGYVLMTVSGYVAAYPALKPRADALTVAGKTALGQIPTECADKILSDLAHRTEADLGTTAVLHAPDFSATLAKNDPGQVKTNVPIFLVHGENDDTIPVQNTRDLVQRYCATGDTVTAKVYPDKGHVDVLQAALPEIVVYLKDRLADKPAPSDCTSGGSPSPSSSR
jgi:pimeloyl-ACP methyl ester carboxylesterase